MRRAFIAALGGAGILRPRLASAQQRQQVIGFLHSGSPGAAGAYLKIPPLLMALADEVIE